VSKNIRTVPLVIAARQARLTVTERGVLPRPFAAGAPHTPYIIVAEWPGSPLTTPEQVRALRRFLDSAEAPPAG
jgi:hypothetical protein